MAAQKGAGPGSAHVDHPSGSVIFRDQCLSDSGEAHFAPGVALFGHACSGGGVVLRPGRVSRIKCGHGQDSGAHCNEFCQHVPESASRAEPTCHGSWAPQDVGVYLERDTREYRSNPGWGKYNVRDRRNRFEPWNVITHDRRPVPAVSEACPPCTLATSTHSPSPSYTYMPTYGWQEFIIDGTHWAQNLPWSIEAFISSRNGASQAAHEKFLAAYSITAEDVPLLTMTPKLDTPFAEGVSYGQLGDPTRLSRGFG